MRVPRAHGSLGELAVRRRVGGQGESWRSGGEFPLSFDSHESFGEIEVGEKLLFVFLIKQNTEKHL